MTVHVSPGLHALSHAIVFDANASASEIWIEGSADGTSLNAVGTGASLVVQRGAPRVHLQDLALGATFAIDVLGGELRIDKVVFHGDPSTSTRDGRRLGEMFTPRRALIVDGGQVHIVRTTFSNLQAGAIAVTAGTVQLQQALFLDNLAEQGGALLVSGGVSHVAETEFQSNRAIVSGGAIHVSSGVVELSRLTRLVQNYAPKGASLCEPLDSNAAVPATPHWLALRRMRSPRGCTS